MTKRLILMRHAKSDWNDPLLDDLERPLNKRGRKSAAALGNWLAEKGFVPDAVLCSVAERTRETLSLLSVEAKTSFLEQLYLAPAQVMLNALKDCDGDTILMVGHNPGIGDLAAKIVAEPPKHPRFLDFPTGATLICDFPENTWADAVSRSAHVVDFIVPRDLIG